MIPGRILIPASRVYFRDGSRGKSVELGPIDFDVDSLEDNFALWGTAPGMTTLRYDNGCGICVYEGEWDYEIDPELIGRRREKRK